jgi:exonuclease VII large subunit
MRLGVVFLVIVLSGTMAMTTLAKSKRNRQKSTGTLQERTTATGSKMSKTQQQNINKLKADLNSIKQGSQVTQAQKDALKNSLTAIVDGATKPDPDLVQQLANDLTQAIADSNLTTKEKIQLATNLQKVMNSANIPLAVGY